MKRVINTIKRWVVQVFGLPIYQITNRVVVERFYSEFDEQFYQKGTKIESYNFVNDSETDKMPIMLQAKADTEIIGARFIVSDGSYVQLTEKLKINNSEDKNVIILLYKTAIQNQPDMVECVFSHFAPVSQIDFNLLPKTTISVVTIIKDKNENNSN